MTIWLLALVLLASLAGLGYRQGAIRVAFSLVGIFVGVLLAVPLAKPAAILLKAVGVVNPVLLWLLPPVVVFCVVSAAFKGIAMVVHRKIEVYFKYKAGDLRLSLWERMNRRLGLCLGLVNGIAYLVLVSFVIYIVSYWTVQTGLNEGAPRSVRLLNRAGLDLQSTGFIKTARAMDRMPQSFYDAADIAGLLYQNSLLEARLARYPDYLMLAESPEFRTLATDQEFTAMRVRQDSFAQVLGHASVQAILNNPETLRMIWGITEPNLKDLRAFLETGRSAKYDAEPLLGHWSYSARATVAAVRRARPNLTARDMLQARQRLEALYTKAKFVIGTENRLVVKDYPNLKAAPAPNAPVELEAGDGSWSAGSGSYRLTLNLGGGQLSATGKVEGDRLIVTADKDAVVFERER
jgi:hypothetical protein